MPTLVNVGTSGSDAKMVRKIGAATIVANKAAWPTTVQRIDRHLEEQNVKNLGQARHKEI